MNYYVTYCVMGPEAGANVFGHACLLLSTQDSEGKPIKVIDSFGFYSQRSTTTAPFMWTLKYLLGIKMDLQGGHGVLKKEEMHELSGNGLSGKTFRVSCKEFDTLKKSCEQEIVEQKRIISDLNLRLPNPNGHTRYLAEKEQAREERRCSRLRPFQIEMNLDFYGLDSGASYTCKTRALDLLEEANIINNSVRVQLEGGVFRAFPRFSGETLLPIRLVGTKKPIRIKDKSGRVFFNRKMPNNLLFFASSLNLHTEQSAQDDALKAEDNVLSLINKILTKARHLEIEILHAIHSTRKGPRKNELETQLDHMQEIFTLFQTSSENYQLAILKEKLFQAQKYLNIAKMSLNQTHVQSQFMLRFMESNFVHHALAGLIGMIIIAPLIVSVTGSALFCSAALYMFYNCYGFYQEEMDFLEMSESYNNYQGDLLKNSSSPTTVFIV